jgi:hypothetical protein
MQEREFATQMNRLIATFGEKTYGSERVNMIYREVYDLDPRWFESVVSHMIGSMRQPPLIPDFRDAAKRERARQFENRKTLESINPKVTNLDPPRCYDCADEGYLSADQKGSHHRRDFVCHCPAGDGKPGTRWSHSLAQHYEIDPLRYKVSPSDMKSLFESWRHLIQKIT